jgi:hypothetical protein
MTQCRGQIARYQHDLAEPELGLAPRLLARHGAAGGLTQHRIPVGPPAAQQPPRRQRDGELERQGRVVLRGPGEHLPHHRVLGIEPAGGRHLLGGAGRQPGPGLPGDAERVPGQRG